MLTRNARIRLILFTLYVLLYGGFVFITALAPDMMDAQPIEGINLAVVYGFALIIGAFICAVIYGVMCGPEDEGNASQGGKQ